MIRANTNLQAMMSKIGYGVEYESDDTLVLVFNRYFEMKKFRKLNQEKKSEVVWNPKLREFIVYKKKTQDFYKVNKLYKFGGKAIDDTDFNSIEYDVMLKIRSFYRRMEWMKQTGRLKGETNDR